jgi:hypothetical protein
MRIGAATGQVLPTEWPGDDRSPTKERCTDPATVGQDVPQEAPARDADVGE